jgi:hypothetical protein
MSTHRIADRRAEAHGERKGSENPRQRDRKIGEQRARLRFGDHGFEHRAWSGQAARIGEERRRLPKRKQRGERQRADHGAPA